jgi:hypothetical protein
MSPPCSSTRTTFAATLAAVLRDTGATPSSIELELTESTLMTDAARFIEVIASVRALGISVAIDDFGTGYSSLAYLKRFQVSKLKVDRSFVKDITDDEEDRAIADAIVRMGQSLKLGHRRRGGNPGPAGLPHRHWLPRSTGLPAQPAGRGGGPAPHDDGPGSTALSARSDRPTKLAGSGHDGQEALVELAVVVENARANLVPGPLDGLVVGVGVVAAAEGLEAVARGIEGVDRGAAGDAVPGGADVDGDACSST